MKAILVARVSDPVQLPALPGQISQLEDYAKSQEFDYKLFNFQESGWSEQDKVGMLDVLKMIRDSKEPMVLCLDKIDRLTRDFSEVLTEVEKLRKSGKVELHFPGDNLVLNVDSPAVDKFKMGIGVLLAKYYSDAIRDNVRRRQRQKLRDGEWPGKAPIGYVNKRISEKVTTVIRDEARDYRILEGFEMRAGRASFATITKHMKQKELRNVLTARSKESGIGTFVTKSQWESILKNPFYYGEMEYLGQLHPHNYEPIVPRWLWEKVRDVNEEKSNNRSKTEGKQTLYRGLITCASCGYAVVVDGPKKGNNYYLKCTEYGGKHGAKWVNSKIINAQVEEVLASIYLPDEAIGKMVAELRKSYDTHHLYYKREQEHLRKEHDAITSDLKVMYQDRLRSRISVEDYDEMVREAKSRQYALNQQLGQTDGDDEKFLITASYLLGIASRAKELFSATGSKVEPKQALVQFVLSNLKLDGEKLLFELKTPFDVIAGCSKDKNWLRRSGSNRRPSG
jgi:site-specific DNA recombinase